MMSVLLDFFDLPELYLDSSPGRLSSLIFLSFLFAISLLLALYARRFYPLLILHFIIYCIFNL